MVYLALTSKGAHDIADLALSAGASLWVGADALTDAEYTSLGKRGLSISRFVYPLASADAATIADAVATVIEHHPHETVWLEQRNAP